MGPPTVPRERCTAREAGRVHAERRHGAVGGTGAAVRREDNPRCRHRGGSSLQRAIDRLPELVVPDVDAILSVLPPELRKIRLGGSLAGFEARAVILLISPDAAALALRERDAPSAGNVTTAPSWGDIDPGELRFGRPRAVGPSRSAGVFPGRSSREPVPRDRVRLLQRSRP